MSDDRRLYLHDLRSDVDGFIHTKQLLNLLCSILLSIDQASNNFSGAREFYHFSDHFSVINHLINGCVNGYLLYWKLIHQCFYIT